MPIKTLELLEWPRLAHHVATFTSTKLGQRAAVQMVPADAQAESQRRLQETQDMVALELMPTVELKFKGIEDITGALQRCERQGTLMGLELLHIATTLGAARQLRRTIDPYPDLAAIHQWVTALRTFPELEQTIHHCIDDQGQVTDRASPKLAELRDRQQQVRQQVQQMLQRLLQSKAGAMQEPIITQRDDRFVLPVKVTQKDAVPGIVHDSSSTGSTLYIEPQGTVALNNQLRQLSRQETVETERVCRELSAKVAAVLPELLGLLDIVTQLDVAMARARYSLWLEGQPPTFTSPTAQPATRAVNLRQFRHPLLLWQHRHEEGPDVMPIDITIADTVRVVAITGPNTGGKTVTLKSMGLAALMAKAGLFLPAKGPVELPWFDQVLADIGDEQSLQQSLSTFSGHIRRIQDMVTCLTPDSLVLLDEVGAGTDPSEGTALAIALLKYLASQARLTIATTHFGELKTLKYEDDRFENASVEFNDVTLSPTYRLQWGIPGRSNALVIAERLGLRGDIIEQAQQYLHHASSDLNEVIADLEAQRRSQELKNKDAARLLRQAEGLHHTLEQKARALQERERSLRQQQEQSVQATIETAKAEIAQVIRRLQKGPQTAQAAQRATQALQTVAAQHAPVPPAPTQAPTGFRPQLGDRLRIPKLGQTAEVISPVTEDGLLTVRFGLMKMTVSLSEVESLTGEKAVTPVKPPSQSPPAPKPIEIRTSQNTIDLRGQRVADAEVILENAIANAQGPLWIIHGHGTGKLRRGVQHYLAQHPRVKHIEAADPADGGTGVTVVRF